MYLEETFPRAHNISAAEPGISTYCMVPYLSWFGLLETRPLVNWASIPAWKQLEREKSSLRYQISSGLEINQYEKVS